MIFSKLMRTNSVEIYVRPGAAGTRVEGIYKDRIKIRVSAPPEKGKANKELIKFVAEILSIPKSCIDITSGKTSNYKVIQINTGKKRDYHGLIMGYFKNNL